MALDVGHKWANFGSENGFLNTYASMVLQIERLGSSFVSNKLFFSE